MRLEGWNHVSEGHGARFDTESAPAWLRLLFHAPVIDRFAYPLLVRRGLGYLRPFPDSSPRRRGVVPGNWRLEAAYCESPGFGVWLTQDD